MSIIKETRRNKMTKIYCYDKSAGAVNMHELSKDQEVKELATIDGVTYIAASDTVDFGKLQSEEIKFQTVDGATLGDKLHATIKALQAALPATGTINAQVVAKIRERYSVDQEIALLRRGQGAEWDEWNNYAESCVNWGREQKALMGLKPVVTATDNAIVVDEKIE
jgi:hypothetical protein